MPSAFIIQTLLNTLHCRFHCSFCRTGEEGNCDKCSVVVPRGSCCSCCWERFSPEAEVLSTVPAVPCMAGQPGTVLEGLPESPPCKLLCWAVARTMCWETDSGLCFLELLFKSFEQHCSRWVFFSRGTVAEGDYSHSRHPSIALLLQGTERTGLSSHLPRWSKLPDSFSSFLSSAESSGLL